MRRTLVSALIAVWAPLLAALFSTHSAAQTLMPLGFATSPTFAWWDPSARALRGDGSYASMSTGFNVISSKRFGTTAGPTVGFEGGRMWQNGDWVYGVVGGFEVMQSLGSSLPAFGRIGYDRNFGGAVQFKAGRFVADNVIVYTKLGAAAIGETWRFGATSTSLPFLRDDIAFGPDARVGVEWAITENLSVALEAGVSRQTLR